jgi:urea transport system ATP-binding protein
VFDSLSVFENLELALKSERSPFAALRFKLLGEQRARIEEILTLVGLTERASELAGILSHGQRQWLEIGMLLMQDPELLLVDEPVAGMTDQETEQTADLLRRIAGHRSVIVVEHDMEFVRALATKVTVLHEGSVLAEGPIDQVQANERVIEVYLGR